MKKILSIEDDIPLQQVYKTKLTNEGFEVLQAFNGDQGLVMAKQNTPDLILLDIMLPGATDGFVVLDKLKKDGATKNIPVIVMTNLDDQVIRAIQGGAVWYFVKAHTPIEEVVNKIKEYLT